MFCRNQTSRATVARGSAMEMEVKRGRFRLSVLEDSAQVSDPSTTSAQSQSHHKLSTTLPKKLHFIAQILPIHIPVDLCLYMYQLCLRIFSKNALEVTKLDNWIIWIWRPKVSTGFQFGKIWFQYAGFYYWIVLFIIIVCNNITWSPLSWYQTALGHIFWDSLPKN